MVLKVAHWIVLVLLLKAMLVIGVFVAFDNGIMEDPFYSPLLFAFALLTALYVGFVLREYAKAVIVISITLSIPSFYIATYPILKSGVSHETCGFFFRINAVLIGVMLGLIIGRIYGNRCGPKKEVTTAD